MDRILFGDNQFFGVNHMSEEKARAQAMRFQDTRAVMKVLDAAYDEGLHTFVCTTHERIAEVCQIVRANPGRYRELVFYPCMPYAHKYANAVTEDGIVGALTRFVPDGNVLSTMMHAGVSLARHDVEGLLKLLIDAEMKAFAGLPTPVIFLQNVVTDLALGLGFAEAFRVFADHVRARYGAEPGFITMNLPRLLPVLAAVGIESPIVCANINKIGFRLCGGRDEYERCLDGGGFRAIAMSVFASGAIPAREALEYVCALPVESILFGASSRENIHETKRLIEALSTACPTRRAI